MWFFSYVRGQNMDGFLSIKKYLTIFILFDVKLLMSKNSIFLIRRKGLWHWQ